jgi:hypothetical protein
VSDSKTHSEKAPTAQRYQQRRGTNKMLLVSKTYGGDVYL